MRILFTITALGLACVPALSFAQVQVPAYRDVQGINRSATGVVILNADGTSAADGSTSTPIRLPTPTNAAVNTITTGGVSQQVFAANATRSYLDCQNPVGATETLFIEIGTAASATGQAYELLPGASLTMTGLVFTGTVNAFAATTGHRLICKQAG